MAAKYLDAAGVQYLWTQIENELADRDALIGTLPVGATATDVVGYIDEKIAGLDVAAPQSGDYVATISETDGRISATMGTKGSVASGQTGLVDGGTVYNKVINSFVQSGQTAA